MRHTSVPYLTVGELRELLAQLPYNAVIVVTDRAYGQFAADTLTTVADIRAPSGDTYTPKGVMGVVIS